MAAKESDPFDALAPVDTPDDSDENAEWLDLEEGESVVGEIREIKENCGEYGSRVYKISRAPGDVVLMWGKASIDRQVDAADLGVGDVFGVRNTGEEYETENGYTGIKFEVRSA